MLKGPLALDQNEISVLLVADANHLVMSMGYAYGRRDDTYRQDCDHHQSFKRTHVEISNQSVMTEGVRLARPSTLSG